MRYVWTEDAGAGLHYWELVNQHLFDGGLVVESKGSNQGLLDAIRELQPQKTDVYYIAFDIVYDNMDIVNKLLELQDIIKQYPGQMVLLDMTCFEYIIFSFQYLVEWTGSGRKDKIRIRRIILDAMRNHRIDIDSIQDEETLEYLMKFKRFSTERVLKSITRELTDTDAWDVKGRKMGACWYKDCCVLERPEKSHCGINVMSGDEKIEILLGDKETQKITEKFKAGCKKE